MMPNERERGSECARIKEKEKRDNLKEYLNGALFCLRDEIVPDDWNQKRTLQFGKGVDDVQNGFLFKRMNTHERTKEQTINIFDSIVDAIWKMFIVLFIFLQTEINKLTLYKLTTASEDALKIVQMIGISFWIFLMLTLLTIVSYIRKRI